MKTKLMLLMAVACMIFSSSCSFRIKARNLPKGLPDYTAYNNGDTVLTDGTLKKAKEEIKVPKKEVSEIKTGQSFTVFYDGKGYNGIYYGKLNVFAELGDRVFMGYNSNPVTGQSLGPNYQTHYNYYLQKRGENEVYDFTSNQLIDMVSDNSLAYRKAKAGKTFHKISIYSALLFIGGLGGGVALQNGPLFTAGLISFPLAFTSMFIGNKKKHKAIEIYNQ